MKKKFFKKKMERFEDCEELDKRVIEEGIPSGDCLYNYKVEIIKKENLSLPEEQLRKKLKLFFKDLPLSSETI